MADISKIRLGNQSGTYTEYDIKDAEARQAAAGLEQDIILGGVYDVSAKNSGATFASLSALLNNANLSTLIPTAVRKGGMSIRFVTTSDNKYVEYMYKLEYENTTAGNQAFINEDNWEKINLEEEVSQLGLEVTELEHDIEKNIIGNIIADKTVSVIGDATTDTGINLDSGRNYIIYVECDTATTHNATGVYVKDGNNVFTLIKRITGEEFAEGVYIDYTPNTNVRLYVRPFASGNVVVKVWDKAAPATVTSLNQGLILSAILSDAFQYSNIVYTNGQVSSATIMWPDGQEGNMTVTYSAGLPTQIVYTKGVNSYTQTITYDANGIFLSNSIIES